MTLDAANRAHVVRGDRKESDQRGTAMKEKEDAGYTRETP